MSARNNPSVQVAIELENVSVIEPSVFLANCLVILLSLAVMKCRETLTCYFLQYRFRLS